MEAIDQAGQHRNDARGHLLPGQTDWQADPALPGVLDRRDKDAITLLFAAVSNEQPVNVKKTQKEIKKAGFQTALPKKALPKKASPSAKYFWSARKGPVKKNAPNSGLNTSIPADSCNQAIADPKKARRQTVRLLTSGLLPLAPDYLTRRVLSSDVLWVRPCGSHRFVHEHRALATSREHLAQCGEIVLHNGIQTRAG